MPSPPRCSGGSSASLSSSSTLHRSNKRHALRLRLDAVRAGSARACLRAVSVAGRPVPRGCRPGVRRCVTYLILCPLLWSHN